MARAVVSETETLFALIVPRTLITLPISLALPGANDVPPWRVLRGRPSLLTPFLSKPSRNWVRWWLASRSANAVGGPPSSVGSLRSPAINRLLVVWYAASTCAAVNVPTGFAAGTTIPAAPSAQFSAGVLANGSTGGPSAAIEGTTEVVGTIERMGGHPAGGGGRRPP